MKAPFEYASVRSQHVQEAASGRRQPHRHPRGQANRGHPADRTSAFYAGPIIADGDDSDEEFGTAGPGASPEDRTTVFVNRGRPSAYRRGLSRRHKIAIVAAAGVVLIIVLVTVVFSGGPSWPASVSTVKSDIAVACQNPDVKSEPGQVNFACAKGTQQVLWVFALLTSNNNPNYTDKNGRTGLEPITPAQGGEVAWSLNLHHPYDPANPIDSLEVAARAINNIVGGATVIGSNGTPAVQPGLESNPANCARYTGSSALVSRQGYPDLCAQPVSSPSGQAALVTDTFKKWFGSPQKAAQAAVLFQNADNPGDPQVQAIVKQIEGPASLTSAV
ncbi:MAG TPA: hypothetical protein VKV33_02950 [Streptosporangiaceae bacterium]|nr:hypothetical protein [Streptosporangiaceae bacterium]